MPFKFQDIVDTSIPRYTGDILSYPKDIQLEGYPKLSLNQMGPNEDIRVGCARSLRRLPAAEVQKIVAKFGQTAGLTTRESNPEGCEAELVV